MLPMAQRQEMIDLGITLNNADPPLASLIAYLVSYLESMINWTGCQNPNAGEAWFRLTPDAPLDPALPYYMMVGPRVEFPLRFTNDTEPKTPEGLDSILAAQQEENGFIRVQLREKTHRFRIDRRTLVLLDENGRATPHQATLTSDGRTIVIEPYSPAVASRVILGGSSIGVAGSRR